MILASICKNWIETQDTSFLFRKVGNLLKRIREMGKEKREKKDHLFITLLMILNDRWNSHFIYFRFSLNHLNFNRTSLLLFLDLKMEYFCSKPDRATQWPSLTQTSRKNQNLMPLNFGVTLSYYLKNFIVFWSLWGAAN